ncbi:hypothetical protein [Streptomyces monomycini]|uniref:hypothetical protein n=1 Tax=Streptomyces monomycini TaxID=371720 RepID=UPI0004AA1ABC|nr:hypothetical protein [Streptomyces monomycini]
MADAHVHAATLLTAQLGVVGLVPDGVGDLGAMSCENSEGVGGDAPLGGLVADAVEAPGGSSSLLQDVDDIDDDVDVDVVEAGFGPDQVELVAGAVDQDHPPATMVTMVGARASA